MNDAFLQGIRLGKVERFKATSADGTAVHGFRPDEARVLFERIVEGPNWMPSGFMAGEAELSRMVAFGTE